MANIAGKVVLLYMGDGGSPEAFTLVGGGTSNSLNLEATEVEFNSKDSGGWVELYSEGAIRKARMSMTGIFKDTAIQESLRQAFSTTRNFRFTLGGSRRFTGSFQVSGYEHTGETEGPARFTVNLSSTGEVTEEAAT